MKQVLAAQKEILPGVCCTDVLAIKYNLIKMTQVLCSSYVIRTQLDFIFLNKQTAEIKANGNGVKWAKILN